MPLASAHHLTLGVILISNEALPKKDEGARMRSTSTRCANSRSAWRRRLKMCCLALLHLLRDGAQVQERNVFGLGPKPAAGILVHRDLCAYHVLRQPDESLLRMVSGDSGCAAGELGGVLVALSIKYTDSIMKTIATTGSIVLTTVLNAAFLSGHSRCPFAGGLSLSSRSSTTTITATRSLSETVGASQRRTI